MTDYAAVIAKVLAARITDSRTLSAKGTVTAINTEGMVTFTDAVGATRKGVWVGDRPYVGGTITFLDEGRGIPVVFGVTGASAPWTAYTPVMSTSAGTPSLGNGTIVSSYRRSGTTLHWRGELTIGSTSVMASGDLRVSLPSGTVFASSGYQVGSAAWWNASDSVVAPGICQGTPGTGYLDFQMSAAGTRFNAANLAQSDAVQWGGTFEVAP